MRSDSPRVAAVQSERRPGRPPFKDMKSKPDITLSADKLLGFCQSESRVKCFVLESLDQLKKSLELEKTGENMLSGIDPYTFDNLPASTLTLQLLTPFPVPTHQSSQFVCETASRLLFISVHWARRTGNVFRNLLYPTQVALMKNSWSSLFLLCLA